MDNIILAPGIKIALDLKKYPILRNTDSVKSLKTGDFGN